MSKCEIAWNSKAYGVKSLLPHGKQLFLNSCFTGSVTFVSHQVPKCALEESKTPNTSKARSWNACRYITWWNGFLQISISDWVFAWCNGPKFGGSSVSGRDKQRKGNTRWSWNSVDKPSIRHQRCAKVFFFHKLVISVDIERFAKIQNSIQNARCSNPSSSLNVDI